jgi:hypothetical protein
VAPISPSSVRGLALLAGVAAVAGGAALAHPGGEQQWTTGPLPSAAAQPAASSTVAQQNSSHPYDERGFLKSSARCDAPLRAAAIVRTDGSLVAICVDQANAYQYRGVRLSDGAALTVPAESLGAREFLAHNDGIDYQLGTEKLVITSGNTLIRREAVLEYKEPQSFSAEAPPTPTPRANPPS